MDHRNVEASGEEPLLERNAQRLHDGKLRAAIALSKRFHQRHGQHLPERWRKTDRNLAGEIGLAAGHGVAGAIELMENASGVDQEAPAGIRQQHAAPVAMQKPQAEFAFQCAHLAADRRLGQSNQRRGTAETSGLGDMDEKFDLPQVHGTAL